MDIKLVVFDLDGVLMDSTDIHYHALNDALKNVVNERCYISQEEHDSVYNGLSTRTKLKMLVDNNKLDESLIEKIFDYKQKITGLIISQTLKKSQNLIDILTYLKNKNIKVACATNCIRSTLDIALRSMEINDLFSFILSNEDVLNQKPFPDIYKECHKRSGISPENTLIFEDSPIGLKAAYASKSHVCRVYSPYCLSLDFVINAMQPVNIVIPMAGAGSRFVAAGYSDPKPLIPVFNKPMISWVVDNLRLPNAKFIFVIRSDYPPSCRDLLCEIAPNCSIVQVDNVTEGAACTVLLTKGLINTNTPLIIANSDQYIEFSITDFFNSAMLSGEDGKISVFDGKRNPKWSYASVNNGYVNEVREKDPFSDYATTGVYMWKHGSDFVRFAEQMISKNIRVNNEFYVVPTYNEAIQSGLKVTISECSKMWGLGTPEDLEFFITDYN